MPLQAVMMGVGLGMDAMSVSAAIGVKWHGSGQKFRLAWHMGLFQLLMPCIGFAVGRPLASFASQWGKYAAALLIAALGAKMLYEALRQHPGSVAEKIDSAEEKLIHHVTADPTRGWSLVAISVATSIDALVVGFSLALKNAANQLTWPQLLHDSLIIGLISALMALLGVNVGMRAGKSFGKTAEIAGAVVLLLLAVSFVVLS
jgi:putative Mn2+ efflux pump MntP